MKRTKKDPTTWRSTPAGDVAYRACRAEAQALANELGFDRGLEADACTSLGGGAYSDRTIVRTDGGEMSELEMYEIDDIEQAAWAS